MGQKWIQSGGKSGSKRSEQIIDMNIPDEPINEHKGGEDPKQNKEKET